SSPCFRLILMRRALMSTLFPYTTLFRSLYYGDTARVPYGSKDSNTVTRYALEAVEFFNGADVDCLVVACNTVSVTALEQMQKFSNKPVYGVLEPGVMALQQLASVGKSDP